MQRMKERIEKEGGMGRIVAVRHFKKTDRVLFVALLSARSFQN